MYCEGNDQKDVDAREKCLIQKATCWFDSNRVSVNASKYQYMVLNNKFDCHSPIFSKEHEFQRVNVFKFIGLYIDDSLLFKHHVHQLIARSKTALFILSTLKHLISTHCHLLVYFAFLIRH